MVVRLPAYEREARELDEREGERERGGGGGGGGVEGDSETSVRWGNVAILDIGACCNYNTNDCRHIARRGFRDDWSGKF